MRTLTFTVTVVVEATAPRAFFRRLPAVITASLQHLCGPSRYVVSVVTTEEGESRHA